MSALYREHRPKNLTEIIGQEVQVRRLQEMVAKKKVPQVILLLGPSGCGKTTIARCLTEAVECTEGNLTELNCADVRGIDTVREINSTMSLLPMGGKARVWILDEVIQLPTTTQQAFLKVLEEPPKHVYFFLCATNKDKLIDTFLSRCLIVELFALSEVHLTRIMNRVLGLQEQEIGKEVLTKLVAAADGNARRGLQILEAVQASKGYELQAIDSFKSASKAEFIGTLLFREAKWKEMIETIKDVKDAQAGDIRRDVRNYAKSILLSSYASSNRGLAGYILSVFREPYQGYTAADLAECCWVVWKNKKEYLRNKQTGD